MKGIALTVVFFGLYLTVAAQTTDREWQAKAVEKYPALGVQGSEFNKRFLEAYTHRKLGTFTRTMSASAPHRP